MNPYEALREAMREIREECDGAPQPPVHFAPDSVREFYKFAANCGLKMEDFPSLHDYLLAVDAKRKASAAS